MKEKFLALFLVSVMVASAFGAMSLSAMKVGAAGTTLTLQSSNYNPTAGQQYTLSGTLRDGNGNVLANKPIDVFYHFPGAGWQFSNTIYTGADGKYSTTATSSQTVILQTGYKVGRTYVASSNVITINVHGGATTLTLSSTNYSPSAGQQYTLSGLLTDGSGNPLANKPIDVFYHFPGAGWQFSNTIYTGADGKYSTTATSSQTVILQTGYKVGRTYVASSNVVTINVHGGATTLTLSGPDYTPKAGEDFFISGFLRDSSGTPVANEPIKIWYQLPTTDGWQRFPFTLYTNDAGYYETSTGTGYAWIYLQSGFLGDNALGYTASSSNTLSINTG